MGGWKGGGRVEGGWAGGRGVGGWAGGRGVGWEAGGGLHRPTGPFGAAMSPRSAIVIGPDTTGGP